MNGTVIPMKRVVIPLLLLVALLCGGVEAHGIGDQAWGIGWGSENGQVKSSLESKGFVLAAPGGLSDGLRWQRYSGGFYAGFRCDVNVGWSGERLMELRIESTEPFLLGTEFAYQHVVARMNEAFGQPQLQDSYMLKMFPGLWISWAQWMVQEKKEKFEILVVETKPANVQNDDRETQKISIAFKRLDEPCHCGLY